jgi:hypothetical protein
VLPRKKPLKKKGGLTKQTSLRSSSGLKKPLVKKPKKRLKLEQKSAQQLIREADKWFSRYIRLRDSRYVDGAWVGECITCDKPSVVKTREGKWIASSQNGHFITRGCYSLRYDELNCNMQEAHCNAWRDKEDMLERYRKALSLKYGEGTYQELKRLSKLPDALKRPTKPELLQIISDAKSYIRHTEENPEHYG